MKIFVTGASGFVGNAVLCRLVEQQHDVAAMARSEPAAAKIRAAGGRPVSCSLHDIAASHVADAEAVIHCAAYVKDWGPREAWYEGNVEGTASVLRAARDAGCRRFIHMGTEAAIVHGQDIDGADESYPLALDSSYPYCATKARAEQLVLEANGEGFETIVLRPRFVWGPGDTTLLPVIEAMADSGQWRWIDRGRARTSTTHVVNLTHAVELALKQGKPGSAYFILDDGVTTMKEMICALAATRGRSLPDDSVPAWVAAAIAAGGEIAWRLFGLKGKPPLTRHAAMVMARTCVLDDAKARQELGYEPVVSREQALRDMST